MGQAQPVVDAQRRALDMKTGTGAKFTCEARIDPAGKVGAVRHIDEAKFVREGRIRLLQPIEEMGDREVLGHVALPGRHRATIGLGPIRHDAISVHPCKFNAVRTGTFARRFLFATSPARCGNRAAIEPSMRSMAELLAHGPTRMLATQPTMPMRPSAEPAGANHARPDRHGQFAAP